MLACSGQFLVLLLCSIIHLVNGSDSETLIEFKDSLINGEKLTTWIPTMSPCDNYRANWEGLICRNETIWGIQLEGKGLEGNIDTYILAGLPSLVSISFNNNNLKGAFPDFGMLDRMEEIILSNNMFSGEIPANAFKGLKWLQKVDLSNNKLVGQIPESLTRLPKLKQLMLQDNQFEGEIPKFDQGNELCGTPLGECQRSGTSTATIIIIALVVATAVGAVLFAVVILSRHSHLEVPPGGLNNGTRVLAASTNISTQEKGGTSAQNGNTADLSLKLTFLTDYEERFDLADLLKASAEILGSGIFGSSYKATLTGGKVMVVKRFKQMNNVGKEEFYEHMRRLGRLRHPNIQPVVAFYYRKEEKLLVSGYVDNISLSFHLHCMLFL